VGAHTYRKRFDLVLAAHALLRELRPDAVLVLHTDRQVSREGTDLLQLAERLGLGDSLVLSTGELPEAALRELYWALDVLVNLSEWEGFGLPVAEAMACGLPVATHRVQGPGELVPYAELVAGDSLRREEAGRQLLEARPATVAALLAAADDEQLRRLGGQGRETAERCFSLQRVLGAWEALLRSGRG
jgi:glycosyltransferase involved in cell wall biosynthesis